MQAIRPRNRYLAKIIFRNAYEAFEIVSSENTVSTIDRLRRTPYSVQYRAVVRQVLFADVTFQQDFTRTRNQIAEPVVDELVESLLRSPPLHSTATLIGLAELEMLRNYDFGHMAAMGRMGYILWSYPEIAKREKAVAHKFEQSLVVELIQRREIPPAQLIEEYLARPL